MSASDDAEASMISKLKQVCQIKSRLCYHVIFGLQLIIMLQACGFEYTSKLQRMFQDIGVSKDLNENFKKHLRDEPLDIDFSIQVLSSGSWPFQQSCVFSFLVLNPETDISMC